MGKSTTPKYVIQIDNAEPMEWNCKNYGRPSVKNLEKYIKSYTKSLECGGVNEHISHRLGYIPYPTKALIRFNITNGSIVVNWKAETFQVW